MPVVYQIRPYFLPVNFNCWLTVVPAYSGLLFFQQLTFFCYLLSGDKIKKLAYTSFCTCDPRMCWKNLCTQLASGAGWSYVIDLLPAWIFQLQIMIRKVLFLCVCKKCTMVYVFVFFLVTETVDFFFFKKIVNSVVCHLAVVPNDQWLHRPHHRHPN